MGSLISLIIIAIVGPIINKQSPGPILFAQERIGNNGKRFKMYKIRSMYMDAEERKKDLMDQNRVKDGMMFKLDFDPRIIGNEILPDDTKKTGIGDFIRRTSLDEFPQFFQVLKGSLSTVGTRPPTIDEYLLYPYHHRARMAMKPGITGMWQVSGRSEITDFEEVVRLDIEYISNWSLGIDLKIINKRIGVLFYRERCNLKNKNKRLCYITLAFVWVFLIVFLTFLPAQLSVVMSESVRKVIRQAGIMMEFHTFRSDAYIVVYFFLGIAIALLGEVENWKLSKQFLSGGCVEILDESIKIVLPTREFDVVDILRDGTGILIAVVDINVASRLRRKSGS